MTKPVWIKATAKPLSSEQHVINVVVADEYTEHTFAMEPEDVLDGDLLIAQLNSVRNAVRLWRTHGDAEGALRVIEQAISVAKDRSNVDYADNKEKI